MLSSQEGREGRREILIKYMFDSIQYGKKEAYIILLLKCAQYNMVFLPKSGI